MARFELQNKGKTRARTRRWAAKAANDLHYYLPPILSAKRRCCNFERWLADELRITGVARSGA